MKKLIYSAAALAMAFFAASCQQENLVPVAQESTVTFSVELPGVQTKTIGDGFNVDQLVYEVWKTENSNVTDLKDPDQKATRLYQETAVMTKVGEEQKTVISLNLVHDQNYTILFWAQNSEAVEVDGQKVPAYVTSDLTAVTYAKEVTDGSYLSNNENMAAFYGVAFLEKEEVEVPSTRRVELKRPFAQLNIGTKNTAEEYEIVMTQSNVTISNVPTVFDVAQNTPASPEVSEYESFEFSYAALPTEPNTLTVNDIPYHYVAMNYIFAGSQNVTVEYNIDATLTAKDSGATTEATVNNTVIEVPLKENYRTNIIGNLLTSTTQYEVVIDASWDDVDADNWDGNVEEVWDENYIQEPYFNAEKNQYEISLASELAWLAAKVNGMPYIDAATNSVKYADPVSFSGVEFVLVEDIDLVGEDGDELVWTPIGTAKEFQGSFDGQGHTISNLVVRSEGTTPAGLFGKVKSGTVKNVTVLNADVQGHGSAAVIVAHGVCAKIDNCHVEEADVLSTPFEGEEANNVGGIVGYLSGETVGYVTNSSVKNATITGYRKIGGVAGAANQTAEVSGNTLENVKVIADQTYEYNEVNKPVDLGAIVGYKHANAIVTGSAKGAELIHKVNSVYELTNAADGAFVTVSSGVYDLIDDVTAEGKAIQILNSEVVINGHDYAITSGSANDYAIITKGNGSSLTTVDANVVSEGGGYAVTEGANLTIKDGLVDLTKASVSSGRYNVYAVGEGTTATINGGTFKFTTSAKRAYIYAGAGATVYVNGGTFGKPSTRSDYKAGILGTGTVIITGGTFGFDPTAWVAPGYHVKKDGANWVVVSLSEGDNLKDAVAVAGATVNMAAGEYVFPSSSIAEGVTINCEEGTVFTGNSKLNIKGATVIGATFSNPTGTAVDQTINGTFENCTFKGSNALRWCYAGETVVFKNCIFSGDVYGVHFDGGANEVYFENCEFSGFNALAAAIELATFKGCTFKANSTSNYNGINLWGSAKMIDTQFVFDGSVANEWIDCCSEEKTYEFTNCTINNGSILDMNYFSARNNGTKIIINDVDYSYAKDTDGFDVDGNVLVANGEYSLPAIQNKTVKIVGSSEAVITINKPNMSGTDITFEGVTLKGSGYATGVQHVNNVTYNGVKVIGEMCLYGEQVVFNNSTFELNNQYVWTYGVKNAKFNGCTFNTNGKAILVYNEGAGATNVAVDGCTFNATSGAKAGAIANQNCAAIEIDNYQNSGVGAAHNVTASNNTYNDYFSGEWRIKNFLAGNPIKVNGVEYTSIAVDGKLMTIDADKNVTVL